MSLRGCPRHSPSTSIGTCVASQSCTSCGTNWKYHFSLPVSTSKAMALSEYRLSPRRESPFQSGEGFPVPQMRRFCSTSNEPVTHVGAPPVFHASPGHVSLPGCPGSGTVQKRQRL